MIVYFIQKSSYKCLTMCFSVRRRFFSGRKSSSSSWSQPREAWNFWESRDAKDSFFGCSDAKDIPGKQEDTFLLEVPQVVSCLHYFMTTLLSQASETVRSDKRENSLNISTHNAVAAISTVLKACFDWRNANNQTKVFLFKLSRKNIL